MNLGGSNLRIYLFPIEQQYLISSILVFIVYSQGTSPLTSKHVDMLY